MDQRYTDSEVAELLSQAAQRQSGGGKDGWTADQVLAMAEELGIDRDHVRTLIAAKAAPTFGAPSASEVLPSSSPSYGSPRNVTLRRRIRGRVPTPAIEDAAEDARRCFNKVRRLELRTDELIVDGSYPGVVANLYIESNATHSTVSLSLDYRRAARWSHFISQAVILYSAGAAYIGNVSGPGWFFAILAFYTVLAFLVGTLVTFVVGRQARQRAEKDFEMLARRLTRSTENAIVAEQRGPSERRTHLLNQGQEAH
jgi:hypothetical protein